jgi:uncharacterized membrane protein
MSHVEILAQLPLFDTLAREDLDALARRLTERRFGAGEKVFDQNDAGTSMYIVLTGAVRIFLPGTKRDEPAVILKDSRPGEYFGELSLFDEKPRSASVTATVDTTLLELTRSDFREHLTRSTSAALTILAEMAERLRETNALLSQRAARDVIKEFEEQLSWSQRLADKVASLNGSWAFILFLLFITAVWAGANRYLPQPFDEYPFQFYNLALAILVALQGPLIVMSQNRQSSKDRATAETDFRVNLKNEVGIETLLRDVAALRAESRTRFEHLERLAEERSRD